MAEPNGGLNKPPKHFKLRKEHFKSFLSLKDARKMLIGVSNCKKYRAILKILQSD